MNTDGNTDAIDRHLQQRIPKMTKLPITLAAVATLAACSTPIQPPQALDLADAGTTAIAISQGFVEMNPVIGIAGDAASPLVALVVKSGLRTYMPAAGIMSQDQANVTADVAGALGTCNNITLFAGAANPLLYGAACAALTAFLNRDKFVGDGDESP